MSTAMRLYALRALYEDFYEGSRGSLEENDDVYADNVPGAGVGLFAKRKFGVGDLVLAEVPFLKVPAKSKTVEESAKDSEAIINSLSEDSDEYRMFFSLSDKYDHSNQVKTVHGIVETNGLPMGDVDELGSIPEYAGMYILTCRVNHSCQPNVHHQWNSIRKQQTLYCIRPISPGDAIVTSYFDCAGLSREDRYHRTHSKWKFDCACPKCQLDGEALRVSDDLQSTLARLDANIQMIAGLDPVKAIRYCRERISLLEEEGDCDPMELVRTYFDAFQISIQYPDARHEAIGFICKAYRSSVIARGLDSAQTCKLEKLVLNPSLFWKQEEKPQVVCQGYPEFVRYIRKKYSN